MSETSTKPRRNPAETRERLIGATVRLMLRQGYAATSVDEICAEAGVTKGSFFHHFENKEAIGRAAVEWWGAFGTALYAEAWKDDGLDPLDQLRRFFDIMIGFTEREDEVCTCMVGMMSQELSQTHPAMREACGRQLEQWTTNCARMLAAAKTRHAPEANFDPEAFAWCLNSLWQGSMLVGKAEDRPGIIRANLRLALAWVESLLLQHNDVPNPSQPS